jgi:hypothetical protein
VSAWIVAPTVRAHGSVGLPIVYLSILTTALGAVLVAGDMTVGDWAASGGWDAAQAPGIEAGAEGVASLVAGTLAIALIGVVILGLPALALVAPCALAWAAAVRYVTERRKTGRRPPAR